MLTRPNEIEPFQIALGIVGPQTSTFRLRPSEVPFGSQPVLEVHAVLAAAFEIAFVRAPTDIVFGWLAARHAGLHSNCIRGRGGDSRGRAALFRRSWNVSCVFSLCSRCVAFGHDFSLSEVCNYRANG